MHPARPLAASPRAVLRCNAPQTPVLCVAPQVLRQTAQTFLQGFPGKVTYAVKANPDPSVLENLSATGLTAFDVASVPEINLLRATLPHAVLHFNNPVRSTVEIEQAVDAGVRSFSLDSGGEFERLKTRLPGGCELSVRYKLDKAGAAYDFGAKFGADPERASELLRAVAASGFIPSLTFHPGTQCAPPEVWHAYVLEAAAIARSAGVAPARLNVGGGFPAHRILSEPPALAPIFETIAEAARKGFGSAAPDLLCEPGRGMVAECCSLLIRVRAVRGDHIFLNDGIYGGLAEMLCLPMTDRIETFTESGAPRRGPHRPWTVFGPTCDSLDRLPGAPMLPAGIAEGDALVVHGMGAYSGVTATRFNGFGALQAVTVEHLQDPTPMD